MKIDVGCGINKKKGFFGVDWGNIEGVEYNVNVNKEGLPFKDNSVDEIYSRHFLEHCSNWVFVLKEFNRVLKKGGKAVVIVPYFAFPLHNIPSHITNWNYTAKGIIEKNPYHFEPSCIWKINSYKLVWLNESTIMKILSYPIKLIYKWNPIFYEKRFSYIYPAYEVVMELEK